jgi:hypothetical protein
MKRHFVPLTAAAMIVGASASADPFIDSVVKNLQELGYEYIEIERGQTQLRAEGVRGNRELEVIYDLATGRIIKQESGRADSDYVGRSGVEIDVANRDFVSDDRSGRSRDDNDDDNDDDDDDDDRSSSRDDDDDDDDRSSSSSSRDDDDDDNDSSSSSSSSDDSDDDNDDDDSSSSSSGGGSDDNDDDSDDDNDDDD